VTTPAERAVIEAARAYKRLVDPHVRRRSCVASEEFDVLDKALRALDAEPPQPDLDALNAEVAEAVKIYMDNHTLARDRAHQPKDWVDVIDCDADRRAALAPNPRYALDGLGFYDHHERRRLARDEVVILLNASEKEK
jgi:hypothetical protein